MTWDSGKCDKTTRKYVLKQGLYETAHLALFELHEYHCWMCFKLSQQDFVFLLCLKVQLAVTVMDCTLVCQDLAVTGPLYAFCC